MAGDKTHRFLCTWKIRKFNYIKNRKYLKSPSFQVKFCHSTWNLVLIPKKFASFPEQLTLDSQLKSKEVVSCQLELNLDSDIVEEIPVSFRFDLLSPNGDVFQTSTLFCETFYTCKASSHHELISVDALKEEMSNWPEDTLTICCLIESMLDSCLLSLTPSETAVTGCKLETNVCEYDSSFMLSLKVSDRFRKYLRTFKEVKLGDITMKVILKHIYGVCKFYLVCDVKDKKHHALLWCVYLMKEKQIDKLVARNFHYFNDQNNVYFTDAEIDLNILQKEIEVRFDLSYLSHSLVNYCYTDEKYDIETQSVSLELFKSGRTSEEESVDCLQQNFKKLLSDKIFTDVELRVDEEIMTAHKNVLAYRSPVFATMFDQQMTENNTGIVNIVDVEAKTFSSFLEYIYTGSVEKFDEELALNLLVVADKYDVPSLAKKCSIFLMSVLSNSNLCKILLIADMVNQKELKAYVIKFILNNSTNVLSSPDWLQLVMKNNTLATELLLLISKKFDEESKIKEKQQEQTFDLSGSLPKNSIADIEDKNKIGVTQSEFSLRTQGSTSTFHPSTIDLEKNLSTAAVAPFQFGKSSVTMTTAPTFGCASNTFTFGSAKSESTNSIKSTTPGGLNLAASIVSKTSPLSQCGANGPSAKASGECSNCHVKNTCDESKCSSCGAVQQEKSLSSFTFKGTNDAKSNNTALNFKAVATTSAPSTGFTFNTPSSTTTTAAATGFTFSAAPASSTGNFVFGAKSEATTTTTECSNCHVKNNCDESKCSSCGTVQQEKILSGTSLEGLSEPKSNAALSSDSRSSATKFLFNTTTTASAENNVSFAFASSASGLNADNIKDSTSPKLFSFLPPSSDKSVTGSSRPKKIYKAFRKLK